MPKWTKKAAIKRMNANAELQRVYDHYPLARVLVESAATLKRYRAYNRISCHYAYKDWMGAVMNGENQAFWTCINVIDDLLPPDAADLQLEGQPCISTYDPRLPRLPSRPARPTGPYEGEGSGPGVLLSEMNLDARRSDNEQRYAAMRQQLEGIAHRKERVHA